MKSHSPQVGPDSARLRSIWHQHWKGEGLSFPSMRLFSFFPHCAETWQPTSQGRVPLLHPLAHWQHPVFVLHKGWLRVVLLMKSKQGQRWCSGLQTFKWLRCGYSWLCVCECVCVVCVFPCQYWCEKTPHCMQNFVLCTVCRINDTHRWKSCKRWSHNVLSSKPKPVTKSSFTNHFVPPPIKKQEKNNIHIDRTGTAKPPSQPPLSPSGMTWSLTTHSSLLCSLKVAQQPSTPVTMTMTPARTRM